MITREQYKHIPILDPEDSNFKEELSFVLNTQGSASDYRNDRNRPYNGQPWTSEGERGKQEVKGLTMRDLQDCLIQAILVSSPNEELANKVFETSNDPDIGKGTEYASKGTWRTRDVYEVDLSKINPFALCDNLVCFVEHYMGIFPNLSSHDMPSTEDELSM